MTHVRTLPYYPQTHGKIEHWHKSLKSECIRPGTPLSLEDAHRGPTAPCNIVVAMVVLVGVEGKQASLLLSLPVIWAVTAILVRFFETLRDRRCADC
jgi:hypothetical protein